MEQKYSRREFVKNAMKVVSGSMLFFPLPFLKPDRSTFGPEILLSRAFYTMGTTILISAYGKNKAQINHAITKAFQEIQSIDTLMSVFKSGSQISQINFLAGKQPVVVDPKIIEILEIARRIHRLSSGKFDITVGPLMNLWGFRNHGKIGKLKLPTDLEITKKLDAVGFEQIIIDRKEQSVGLKNPESLIDLGGIAVGYSVDRAVKALKSEGIENAFINHSGDAFAMGAPPEADGWDIVIPNPLNPEEMIIKLRVRDHAISTSGNYRNYISVNSLKYGHILDPHQGKPTSLDPTLSTTIIGPSAADTDGYATGCFIQGKEKGIQTAAQNGLQYIFLGNKNEGIDVKYSNELKINIVKG